MFFLFIKMDSMAVKILKIEWLGSIPNSQLL